MSRYLFRATEISGLKEPTYNSGAANKKYVDDNAGAASLAGSLVGNMGSDFSYGISGLSYVSSQSISGGTIIGDLNYPYTFTIYKKGSTYYSKDMNNGAISSSADATNIFDYAIDNCSHGGKIFVKRGVYAINKNILIDKAIHLEGEGLGDVPTTYDVTTIKPNSTSFTDKYMMSANLNGGQLGHVTIKDMRFDGHYYTHVKGGIIARDVASSRFENLFFDNFYASSNTQYPLSGIALNLIGTAGIGNYYNILDNIRTRRCTCSILISGTSNGNMIFGGHINDGNRTHPHDIGIMIDGGDTNVLYGPCDLENFSSEGQTAVYLTSSAGTAANRFYGLRTEGCYNHVWIASSQGGGRNLFDGCSFPDTPTRIFDYFADSPLRHSVFINCNGYRDRKLWYHLSSQAISGGTIITKTPTEDSHVATKKYVDDEIGAGVPSAPGGSLTANIGSDFTYGASGLAFMSSQAISGGSFVGGLHYPSDYIVYKNNTNYIAKSAINGKEQSYSYFVSAMSYAISELPSGGTVYLPEDKYIMSVDSSKVVGVNIQSDNIKIISNGATIYLESGMSSLDRGSTLGTMINIDADSVTIEGLIFDGNRYNQSGSVRGISVQGTVTPYPRGVRILNNEIKNTAGYGIYLSETDSCWVDSNYIHDIGKLWKDPGGANHNKVAKTGMAGIVLESTSVGSINSTIINNKITRVGEHGIKAYAGTNCHDREQHNLIMDNYVSGCNFGILQTGAEGNSNGYHINGFRNSLVDNFLVIGPSGVNAGIQIYGSYNTIKGNHLTITDVSLSDTLINLKSEADDQQYGCSGNIVSNNILKGAGNKSIAIQMNKTACNVVEGNVIKDIKHNLYMTDDDSTITHDNVITNNYFGGTTLTITDGTVEHNTIANNNMSDITTFTIDNTGKNYFFNNEGYPYHNISGSVDGLISISSQAISGGSYKNISFPADYVIGKDGDTYFARRGSNGNIVISDDSAANVLNFALSSCGWNKTQYVGKWIGSGLVYLSTDIELDATISGAWKTTLDLGGHTIWHKGDFHGIKMRGGFTVRNGEIDWRTADTTPTDSALIWFLGSNNSWNTITFMPCVHNVKLIGNTDWNQGSIPGADPYWYSGTGILFDVPYSGTYEEILGADLRNVHFHKLEYAIKGQALGGVALNGVFGDELVFNNNRYNIWLSGNKNYYGWGKMDISGWNLQNCIFQTGKDTRKHLYLGSNVNRNKIEGIEWDQATSDYEVLYESHPSSEKNVFTLTTNDFFDDYLVDNGSYNSFKGNYTTFSPQIFSLDSKDFYTWNKVGGIDSDCRFSSSMWNFPLVLVNPDATAGRQTGIGFHVGEPDRRYTLYSPMASITVERVHGGGNNAGMSKMHFRTKDFASYTSTYLTAPTMTIYSGNVGIGCDTPQNYKLQVSGTIYTKNGAISSQAISGGSITTANLTLAGGASLTYLSSQTISGGSYKNIYLPSDVILYRDNGTFYVKNGQDGSVDYSDTEGYKALQYAIDNCASGTVTLMTNIGLGSTVSGAASVILNLNGHTISSLSSFVGTNKHLILSRSKFHIENGVFDVSQYNFSGNKVIYYNSLKNPPSIARNQSRLTNLQFKSNWRCWPNYLGYCSGTCIDIHAGGGGSIGGVIGTNLTITDFEYAIRLRNEGHTGTCFINSCLFDNICAGYNTYLFYLSGNVGVVADRGCIRSNRFTNYLFQAGQPTKRVVWCNESMNVFKGRTFDFGGHSLEDIAYEFASGNKTMADAERCGQFNYLEDYTILTRGHNDQSYLLEKRGRNTVVDLGWAQHKCDIMYVGPDTAGVGGYYSNLGSKYGLKFYTYSSANGAAAGNYAVYTRNAANDGNLERFTIRNQFTTAYAYFSNCKVGINDTTPDYELDVVGDINADGGIFADGISSQAISGGSATINTINYSQPPMNFSVSNIEVSANHAINMTRFDAGSKKVYLWQAAACNSGGTSVSGLCVELLSGSTSVYKTSSAIIQQGYPLATSDGGLTKIRFMYSGGASLSGKEYGTGFMNVSVY